MDELSPLVSDRRAFLHSLLAVTALPIQRAAAPGTPVFVVAALRRAYEALDDAALEAVLAPDVHFSDPTFHHEAKGFDAMRPLIADVQKSLATVRITVEHEIACGSWVIARQRQAITMREPAGKKIEVRGVSLFRVERGRIAEWCDYYDALGFQQQMRDGGGGAR